ncbi:MAG TPA: prepilin-type N-terminal cleavage/methylation domain-containing protein [Bacteroidota bacterium]|jgi:type II secretory pathway component PulJ|nr:prepilin-type N-terminal cleavage/methylation domain-containing protein [Bacteroidota bacterium]
MAVTLTSIIRNDEGYTLLETLVAMALFLSVLIPFGVMIGNFILDDSASSTTAALHTAESAMSRMIVNRDFTSGTGKDDNGLIVDRKIEGTGNVRQVHILVFSQKNPKKLLLKLDKTLLVYK